MASDGSPAHSRSAGVACGPGQVRTITSIRTRRLLVTGCGRSGTRFISFVLRRLGLDVPHERLGRDGIVSWSMAVHACERPFGPPSGSVHFEHVFHQTRHPLDVISSVATFKHPSWEFICAHTPCSFDDPLILRSAKYWLHWSEHADQLATWRYRVEALGEVFPEFCERLDVDVDLAALERVSIDVNTRRRGRLLHLGDELAERLRIELPGGVRERLGPSRPLSSALTWDDITAIDRDLATRIREKAVEYGYGD